MDVDEPLGKVDLSSVSVADLRTMTIESNSKWTRMLRQMAELSRTEGNNRGQLPAQLSAFAAQYALAPDSDSRPAGLLILCFSDF